MQEGSLRCDANVNLHIADPNGGTIATPIVEVKNLNSFRGVEQAIEYEAERQFEEWKETGQEIGRRAQRDARLGRRAGRRRSASAARRRRPIIAISPIPISCR